MTISRQKNKEPKLPISSFSMLKSINSSTYSCSWFRDFLRDTPRPFQGLRLGGSDLPLLYKSSFWRGVIGFRKSSFGYFFIINQHGSRYCFLNQVFWSLWQTFTAAQTGFNLIQSYDLTVRCDAVNKCLHQMLVPSRINPRGQFSVRDKYYASCFIQKHDTVIELY